MRFIAIGTFHDHVINVSRKYGVAQQWKVIAPNITREPEVELASILFNLQRNSCRAQYVPRFDKTCHYPRYRNEGLFIIQWMKKLRCAFRICFAVKWFDGFLAARETFAIHKFGI